MARFTRLLHAGLTLAVLSVTPAIAVACPTIPASDLTAPGKLQMSINPTLPPQQYVDQEGKLQGLSVELGREIAKRLCLEPEFIRMDFPGMIPALQAGRFDMINTGMFWTEERSKIIFTVKYGVQAISVVVPNDSTVPIKTTEDLAGHSVAVESNSYQFNWLAKVKDELVKKGKPPIDIKAFPTATGAMSALMAGQVDAAALIDHMGADAVKKGQVKEVLSGQGGTQNTFAFRKRSVAQAVADALNAMRADGTYDRLFQKFGVTPVPKDQRFEINGPGPNAS